MRLLLFACVLAVICAPAFGQPTFEFKGVGLGANSQIFQTEHNQFKCITDREDPSINFCFLGLKTCRYQRYGCGPSMYDHSTYAGETVEKITAFFLNDAFERLDVDFKPDSYEAIRDALTAKYGKPSGATKKAVTTVGGAKATNEEVFWSFGTFDILISRYGQTLSEGSLSVMSATYHKTVNERQPQKDAARQKNM